MINMNPLGKTQRDFIRQHNEQDTFEEVQEEDTQAARADDVAVKMRTWPKERKGYFLPKCFLLGIALMALLAGVAVLIHFYREKGPDDGLRGDIIPTKPPEEECPDINVMLGDVMDIRCKFQKAISGDVHAVYENVAGATKEDFECIKSQNGTAVNCMAKGKAKCSSHGIVTVRFFDTFADDKRILFVKKVMVNVTVPDRFHVAEIEQIYKNSINQSEFNLRCAYTKDCKSYQLRLFGNGKNLADTQVCASTYSDDEGYTVSCSATVPSSVILDNANGSKLYCQLMHGTDVEKPKELAFPFCHDVAYNKEQCNANTTTLFDCQDIRQVRENCTKECLVAKECFPVRVKEWSNPDSDLCPTQCALQWCRRNEDGLIDSSGRVSFRHFCPAA